MFFTSQQQYDSNRRFFFCTQRHDKDNGIAKVSPLLVFPHPVRHTSARACVHSRGCIEGTTGADICCLKITNVSTGTCCQNTPRHRPSLYLKVALELFLFILFFCVAYLSLCETDATSCRVFLPYAQRCVQSFSPLCATLDNSNQPAIRGEHRE